MIFIMVLLNNLLYFKKFNFDNISYINSMIFEYPDIIMFSEFKTNKEFIENAIKVNPDVLQYSDFKEDSDMKKKTDEIINNMEKEALIDIMVDYNRIKNHAIKNNATFMLKIIKIYPKVFQYSNLKTNREFIQYVLVTYPELRKNPDFMSVVNKNFPEISGSTLLSF